jgi:CheY-like chemotaxis protein
MAVIVIGLGGIGSALVEPLARYLNFRGEPKELLLVDGDSYEKRNLDRQRAGIEDIAVNKARTHAERLRREFKDLEITWQDVFVTPANVKTIVNAGDFVLACVDNHATRKVLQDRCLRLRDMGKILAGNGFNVISAGTTEEAEHLFIQHRKEINLLLTDFEIPSADGQELCNRLSAVQSDLKVLIMSGYVREWLLAKGQLEPQMPFIEKPFMLQNLMDMLRKILC